MMPEEEWSCTIPQFGPGCGGCSFMHNSSSQSWNKLSTYINAFELLTILVGLWLWAHALTGKRIVVNCDNSAFMAVLNRGQPGSY